MQTFLPSRSFEKAAKYLDYRRLGKQRVEAKTIHTIITKGSTGGWSNHPAVNMWRGYERELAGYYNTIVDEWIDRGYVNNMPLLAKARYTAPSWVSCKLITSHRSNLLRKNATWYSQFGWDVSDDLPYHWPK